MIWQTEKQRTVMLGKIIKTLAKFGFSVFFLSAMLQLFEIKERSITAIILAIGVWHVVEWAIDNLD